MTSGVSRITRALAAAGLVAAGASQSQAAQDVSPNSAARCRVNGHVVSGRVPLPGVALVVRADGAVKAATSTDVDGSYAILLPPESEYQLTAELSAFAPVARDLTLESAPCDRTLDLQLVLPAEQSAAEASAGRGVQRFETVTVQPDAAAEAMLEASPENDGVGTLLPAGFSPESSEFDAIAIAGGRDATNLDRDLMNDRLQAIDAGQFDPTSGEFGPGFRPGGGSPGAAQEFGRGGPQGRGPGPGGQGGGGGQGGRGPGNGRGPGDQFVLGGRPARARSPYQGTAIYTFGGSALDTPPFQLRPDVAVTQPSFAQNRFGATLGGPLRIPGLYSDDNRRTNFQLNYNGSRANNLFDRYATVPTDAMRSGDFSSSRAVLVDPATGLPFPDNRIPAARIDPASAALLSFIPVPNLPGGVRNFHTAATANTTSDAFSVRLNQNLSSPVNPPGRGNGGGGQGSGRGNGNGRGGGRRNGPRGTNVSLNAQLQYRRNASDSPSVFQSLSSQRTNTSIAAPLQLNIKGRSTQHVNFNITHSDTLTTNGFAGQQNVAADSGIQLPASASTDPMNWGVPNLVFSGMTSLRSAAASARSDTRLSTGYSWARPLAKHQLRFGGNLRLDRSTSDVNANARGTFTFTGLYTAGAPARRGTGADFADFLLGFPAQATLQVGTTSRLRQHSYAAFIEDNWQRSAKLTFNLGLRYELALPYVETSGRMANLDVAPSFASATPVTPGAAGPFTGTFPSGLLNHDANNLGPRVAVAYRWRPQTVFRAGYSVTYNSGSYASIARELTGQPPFAETETVTATADEPPLTLAEALLAPSSTSTNNWGVDRDYALGLIQTWNASVTRNLTPDWTLQAGYTRIKGTGLDVLRAPALGPGGVLIPDIQPFIWESSGGHSTMNGLEVDLRRKLAHGVSGGFSYKLAKSMDNASSLGAGGAVVAQNDKDLAAEWAPSSFDRRQQLAGNVFVELPWGRNRRWLNDGGTLASIVGDWSARLNLALQTGTPLTARVLGAASDLLRGVNGSLRADYNGAPIQLPNPTLDAFFNVFAFSTPDPGEFGSSTRNMIVGPGARQLNGLFERDLHVGGGRTLTLQMNATNLLNTVQWAAVDTNINSPTFGQVTAARPMRTIALTARFKF